MKNILINLVIAGAIVAGAYTKEFMDIDYVSNISIVLIWFIIALMSIGISMDSNELFKKGDNLVTRVISRIICLGSILFIIAVGWVVTGTLLLILGFILYLKRKDYEESLNG